MRPNFFRTSLIFSVVLVSLWFTGCGDTEASRKRLLETGKKFATQGKLSEATLVYRQLLQKDPRNGEAYYQLGLANLKLGRMGEAVKALRRASELQPDNNDAHQKLGDIYLTAYLADREKNKPLLVDFRDLSERLLKRNPNSFEGLRMQGYLHVASKEFKEAVDSFRAAEAVKPGDSGVTLALTQALLAAGQKDEAVKTATTFLEKNKNFGAMYDFLYVVKLSERKIDEAEGILKSKVENNPKQADYYLELALHYVRANKRDLMKATLDKVATNRTDFPKGRTRVGDFYFRLKMYPDAREQYELASSESGDKLNNQKKIIELLASEGKRQEALDLAQKLADEYKNDAEVRALRAALRLQGGTKQDVESAVTELQAVLAKLPKNPVVRTNLGDALLAKGDLDQAKVQFTEALKLRPDYVPAMLALARISLMKQDFAKASEGAQEVIKLAPGNVPARIIYISALMNLKQAKDARAQAEMLLKAQPELTDAIYLKAMIDFSEAKYPDAEVGFRKLFQRTPPDMRGLGGTTEVMMATGRSQAALQMLEEELKKNPKSRGLRTGIGNIYVRMQKYDQALEIYKGLLQEDPNATDTLQRVAETCKRAGKYDEAIQFYEKWRKIDANNVAPYMQLAQIYEITNKRDQLRPMYEQILKFRPDEPLALNNLAYLLADEGLDLDQAVTLAQRAKMHRPSDPNVADTLGWVYIKKNMNDDAVKVFADLLSKKPDHVTWRYHLAYALFQKGDTLQARKELETAMKNKPTKDETQRIQELMKRL